VKYIGVSGFLFLRLICAAINSPKLFKLMDDHPDAKQSKILTQVAKVIIKISTSDPDNLIDDDSVIDTFIKQSLGPMKDFLDFASSSVEEIGFNPAPVELDRQLSLLIEFFEENLYTTISQYYLNSKDVTLCNGLINALDDLAKEDELREPYLPQLIEFREAHLNGEEVNLPDDPKKKSKKIEKKARKLRNTTSLTQPKVKSARVKKKRTTSELQITQSEKLIKEIKKNPRNIQE